LVKTPKIAEPLVKMSGFPDSPRALVITATASRSLAKLSGVPSTCPMLAVLTMASTWAAGAARLAGTAKSPATGVRPATLSFAAAASDRDKARTSWPCCDSFRATAPPINPVAPVTRIFIVPPSDNQMPRRSTGFRANSVEAGPSRWKSWWISLVTRLTYMCRLGLGSRAKNT
jgi:hypothetical protein